MYLWSLLGHCNHLIAMYITVAVDCDDYENSDGDNDGGHDDDYCNSTWSYQIVIMMMMTRMVIVIHIVAVEDPPTI